MLDRGEQGLAFGHQQTQILRLFSGFLEHRDFLGRAVGARIVGDLEQNSHTHDTPQMMNEEQKSGFPQEPEWKTPAPASRFIAACAGPGLPPICTLKRIVQTE